MFQPVFVLDCLLLYPHVGAGIHLECRITVNSDIISASASSHLLMNVQSEPTGTAFLSPASVIELGNTNGFICMFVSPSRLTTLCYAPSRW